MFLKNLQKILVAIDNWTDDREREHVALSAHDLYIQLYASYANTQTAFLSGRVLQIGRAHV